MKKCGIRRVISLLLSLAMVLCLCLAAVPGEAKAAEGGTVSVDVKGVGGADPSGLKPGDKIEIAVSISSSEVYEMNVLFSFDKDKLQVDSAVRGGLGGDIEYAIFRNQENGTITGGEKNTCQYDENPLNGTLFTAVFTVKDTAKGSIATDIKPYTYDRKGNKINVDVVNNASLLNVSVPINSISLDQTSLALARGRSGQLNATVDPADAEGVLITWTSDNPAVATVSPDGKVTAVGKGETKITASASGKNASCIVKVTVPLEGMTITGTTGSGISSETGVTIKKGTAANLKVTFNPVDAEHDKVVWESSDSSKVNVVSTGTDQAVASAVQDTGTAPVTITAKAGNVTGTFSVTVQEVKMTGIELKKSMTLNRGAEEGLTVTYLPEETTDDRTVKWSSSNPDVAAVDGNGTVSASAVGTANIEAKVGNFTKTCAVTVLAPLEKIIPGNPSVSLIKNQTRTIRYELSPADTTDSRNVTFSSDNPVIASVDPVTGEVTGNAAGTAVITLTGANGITASVTVTVTEIPIDSLTISGKKSIIEKGTFIELVGVTGPADTTDDTTIRWESSDSSIVTVDPATSDSGEAVRVTATDKGGKAVIRATAGKDKVAEYEVEVPIHLEGITLPASVTMNRKETVTLKAAAVPENTTDDAQVTWTSSNEAIAAVNSADGTVTALKEGKAVITAKTTNTMDGSGRPYEAKTTVTVKENHLEQVKDKIEFDESDLTLLKNQSMNMNSLLNLEKLKEDNGITDDTEIQWSGSDETVAVIDQTGMVTGLKEGSTTITAVITAKDGNGAKTGEYSVDTELKVREIPLKSIAFDKIITEMKVGATDTLKVIYEPEDMTDSKDVQWSSSDSDILSVDNGKLTARKAGTAEITAKMGDMSVTCKIKVTDNQEGKPSVKPSANDSSSGGKNVRKGIQTGDTSHIAVWLLFILTSLSAMAAAGMRIKQKVRR